MAGTRVRRQARFATRRAAPRRRDGGHVPLRCRAGLLAHGVRRTAHPWSPPPHRGPGRGRPATRRMGRERHRRPGPSSSVRRRRPSSPACRRVDRCLRAHPEHPPAVPFWRAQSTPGPPLRDSSPSVRSSGPTRGSARDAVFRRCGRRARPSRGRSRSARTPECPAAERGRARRTRRGRSRREQPLRPVPSIAPAADHPASRRRCAPARASFGESGNAAR